MYLKFYYHDEEFIFSNENEGMYEQFERDFIGESEENIFNLCTNIFISFGYKDKYINVLDEVKYWDGVIELLDNIECLNGLQKEFLEEIYKDNVGDLQECYEILENGDYIVIDDLGELLRNDLDNMGLSEENIDKIINYIDVDDWFKENYTDNSNNYYNIGGQWWELLE